MDNASNNESKLLSIGEASEYLGISIDTLRRWDKKGKIDSYRSPGGHRYFKKDDLDNLFGTKYDRYSDEEIKVESKQQETTNTQPPTPEPVGGQELGTTNEENVEPPHLSQEVTNEENIVIPKIDSNVTEDINTYNNVSNISIDTAPKILPSNNTNANNITNLEATSDENTTNLEGKENDENKQEVVPPVNTEVGQNSLIPKDNATETKMLDNQQLNKLHNILENNKSDEKATNKTFSKGYKLAVTAIAVFIIIDIVLVLALLSAPKIISPIP